MVRGGDAGEIESFLVCSGEMRVFKFGNTSPCPVMKADRSIDVVVAFSREEKKLDTSGRLLPLVSDDRLHNVSLRLLVLGQHRGGSIPGFQPLACAVEEFLISDEVPVGMLVLEFDFYKALLDAEVKNCALEGRLDQSFDRPGFTALDNSLVNDSGAGAIDDFRNLLLSFVPMKTERRVDLLGESRRSFRKAEQSGHKP